MVRKRNRYLQTVPVKLLNVNIILKKKRFKVKESRQKVNKSCNFIIDGFSNDNAAARVIIEAHFN